MHKVKTAYSLNDPRKFESIEEAEKELNRLRVLCIRLKKKQAEEVHFLLGLSITSHDYVGRMGYDKPKNKGGKKQFICSERLWKIDPSTGEVLMLGGKFSRRETAKEKKIRNGTNRKTSRGRGTQR